MSDKPNYKKFWILNDQHELIEVDSVYEWGRFFEDTDKRRVGGDQIADYFVSTVFLGIDHNWDPEGPPLLFETMVFRSPGGVDLEQVRYASWDLAALGHKRMVAKYRKEAEMDKKFGIDREKETHNGNGS